VSNQAKRKSERERERRRRSRLIGASVAASIVLLVVIVALATRSGDDVAGPELSALGEQGKALAVTRSCTGCHGRSGEGNTGPAWVGLFGSTRELQDGTTVVADRAYLAESIVDPNAKQVAGFGRMPQDSISDADVAALVQYIIELAAEPASDSTPVAG
jgi:cytochrome c553